jgi:hypothetical protein
MNSYEPKVKAYRIPIKMEPQFIDLEESPVPILVNPGLFADLPLRDALDSIFDI